MTTEIPQKRWREFCDRLNGEHRGAVTIRTIEPDGNRRPIVEDVPLQMVSFRNQNGCNDMVTIEAGLPSERPAQHQILEPIRILLRKDGESGRYNQLEILAETGTTEVIFHPGINPALMETLAA